MALTPITNNETGIKKNVFLRFIRYKRVMSDNRLKIHQLEKAGM
jgi:hypothetical protein